MKNNLLQVKNLTKYYTGPAGSKHLILDKINFNLEDDENKITSILAPFGSGKSTLLKIIANIEEQSAGEITLNGKSYNKPLGLISYLPEKPSSFPWLNVKQNIELSFKIKSEREKVSLKINELISLVGLTGYDDHFPNNKSIGFRFRISLARALAMQPDLILIDDCFKGLDLETKKEIFGMIKSISSELNIVFLYASTNVSDLIEISNKILLMKKNPGNIFKEIQIEKIDIVNEIQISEKFTFLKNLIENEFRKENVVNTIDISI